MSTIEGLEEAPDDVSFDISKSSLWHWSEKCGDPNQPETVKVEVDYWHDFSLALEMPSMLDEHLPMFWEAIAKVGGPPAFLRTPFTSGKYGEGGVDDCRLTADPQQIKHAILCAVRDNGRFLLPSPSSFVVREWLDIDESPAGYPLEFRFIVTQDGEIEKWFDYYFQRDGCHDLAPPPSVFDRAKSAAEGLSPFDAWSVDFARDTDGEWWLIDMGKSARSHQPDEGWESDGPARRRGRFEP